MRATIKPIRALLLILAGTPGTALSQESTERQLAFPEATTVGESSPAPDWMTWLAFHRSIEFYFEQSSPLVTKLLTEKIGIDKGSVSKFLELGAQYSKRHAAEDVQQRRQATQSLKTSIVPAEYSEDVRTATKPPQVRRSPTAAEHARYLASRTGATSPSDALSRSGLAAEFENQRNAALRDHQTSVRNLLGEETYRRLNAWINIEVKPNVRIANAGVLLDKND